MMNKHGCGAGLLSAATLSEHLGISKARVYQLAREGVLPCVRLGRTIRFDPAVIQDFIGNGGASFAHGWRKEPLS